MDYSYNYMQQAQLHRRAPGAGAPPAGGNSAFVALPGMQQLSSDGATGLPQQDYMLAPYPGEGAQQVPYYQPVPQAAPSVLPQAPPALLQGRSSGGGSHRSMILPHTLSARYGSSADDADILAAAEDEGGYAAAYRGAGTAPPASALQASGADGAAAAYGAPAITVPGPMATTGGSGAGRAPPPGPSRPTGASPAPSPVPAEETLDTDATEMLMSMPPGANTMRLLMAGEEARLATHFRDEYTNAYYNVELQVRRAVYTCIDGLPSVDGKPAIPGMRERYGFHTGRIGGASCAKAGLVADLMGGAGPVKTYAEVVCDLHSRIFSNYNIWATSVGGQLVLSPDAMRPQDIHEKLCDLALWYLIRAEAANLRFCPELLCWLHHQMKAPANYMPPRPSLMEANLQKSLNEATTGSATGPRHSVADIEGMLRELQTAQAAGDDMGFFFSATVQPLYDMMKRASVKDEPATHGTCSKYLCCWASRAQTRLLPNSRRPNYDDFNEMFWNRRVLRFTYHNLDADRGVQRIGSVIKNFRERSSYLSLLVNFFPWWLYLAVMFHATLAAAEVIVKYGGRNFADVSDAPSSEIIERMSLCMITLVIGKIVQVVASLIHSAPDFKSRHVSWTGWFRKLSFRGVAKVVYHCVWAGIILFLAYYKDLFGGGLWWAAVAVRLVFIAIGNGFFHALVRSSWIASNVEYFISDSERVYTNIPLGGPLGGNLLRQDWIRVLSYVGMWLVVMVAKALFDIQVQIQAVRASQTVQSITIPYAWGFLGSGTENVWISIGTWIMTGLLISFDSYIAFSFLVPLIGTAIVWRDGIGRIRDLTQVRECFLGTHRSMLYGKFARLADQFVTKCLPSVKATHEKLQALAKAAPTDAWLHTAVHTSSVDYLFAKAWNLFVSTLREEDLVNDLELSRMTYGPSASGMPTALPLFLIGDALPHVADMELAMQWVNNTRSDAELLAAARQGNLVAANAMLEVLDTLPRVVSLITRTHNAMHSLSGVPQVLAYSMTPSTSFREALVAASRGAVDVRAFVSDVMDWSTKMLSAFCDPSSDVSNSGSVSLLYSSTAQVLHRIFSFCHNTAGEQSAYDTGTRSSTPAATDALGQVNRIMELMKTPSAGATTLRERLVELGLYREYYDLVEQAYRCYAMLTARPSSGNLRLKVGEAERRIAFWVNSMYMRATPVSSSFVDIPSFMPVTPQYAEAVLYERESFLEKLNVHGVSPMLYLRSLHAQEWQNFCNRLGVEREDDVWMADTDATGEAVDGTHETRLWASNRGQTLARTVRGVMEYARGMRVMMAHELYLRDILRHADMSRASRPSHAAMLKTASVCADWLVTKKIGYTCCCQKYSDSGVEDVSRRKDIDDLLQRYPLLSVVYFDEAPLQDGSGRKQLFSICINGMQGVRFRVPLPGHPIRDGIGEGKPENQNNGAPYMFGRIIQTLDMNQEGYIEEALKLPNALTEFRPRSRMMRPVVLLGLREHVFTHSLSTSALFMSYQELQFGVVWQRVMASPMRVRMHYGHPDMMDKLFMMTRGGFAKASRVINVSEDVFAGFMATLRGGESHHIEYMQMGKGRDIGLLQIAQFEAKVSGGSGMSMTTRDASRLMNNVEFFRMFSLWHSWAGYYVTCALTSAATIFFLYYVAALALSGVDNFVLGLSNSARLVGDVLIINLISQLGLLYIVPLLFLLAMERGVLSALWRMVHLISTFGPIFYVAEMHTKAYYFDQALSFGRQVYLATGRDFVIRHLTFDEIYRSIAYSHLYVGMEMLYVLTLILVYGSFESLASYVFFFAGSSVFIVSVLFAFFWFNPFAMEIRYIVNDFSRWVRWLRGLDGSTDVLNFNAWYRKSIEQYEAAPAWTRVYHFLRLGRWVLLAGGLLFRTRLVTANKAAGAETTIYVVAMFLVPLLFVVLMQLVYMLNKRCCPGTCNAFSGERTPTWAPTRKPFLRIVQLLLLVALVAVAVLLAVFAGQNLSVTGGNVVEVLMVFIIMTWFYCRAAIILNVRGMDDGVRSTLKMFDIAVGSFIIGIQMLFAALVPFGSTIHAYMLFSTEYAATLEMVLGARPGLRSKDRDLLAQAPEKAPVPAAPPAQPTSVVVPPGNAATRHG